MKKTAQKFGVYLIAFMICVLAVSNADAEMDWTVRKQIDLDVQPLDIAASADGKFIFVLAPGEILVYPVSGNKVTSRIPVEKDFNRVTYSVKNNALILTGKETKRLKILQIEQIYNLVTSGLPVKGPVDAPVTIAVFDDYQ